LIPALSGPALPVSPKLGPKNYEAVIRHCCNAADIGHAECVANTVKIASLCVCAAQSND
jgi:hypothetical protein